MDLLIVLIASLFLVTISYAVLVNTSHTSMIDLIWCFGVTLASIFYSTFAAGEITPMGWHVIVLHILWFLRLGGIIVYRTFGLPAEAGWYLRLRETWGKHYRIKLFQFYIFQGVGICLFSLPAWSISHLETKLSPTRLLAVALCLIGITGSFLADWTLTNFRRRSENGKTVCTQGLWRYSRHPNFFFEWMFWLGLAFVGINGVASLWIFIFPAMTLVFLLFITGVPTVEAQAIRSRGDAYRAYQRSTSMFIPWFPKKKVSETT